VGQDIVGQQVQEARDEDRKGWAPYTGPISRNNLRDNFGCLAAAPL